MKHPIKWLTLSSLALAVQSALAADIVSEVEVSQALSGQIPTQGNDLSVPWGFGPSKYSGQRDHMKLFYDWKWDEKDPQKNWAGFRPSDYGVYFGTPSGTEWDTGDIRYTQGAKVGPNDNNYGATKEHHQAFNSQASGKMVGLYYGEWGIWERGYAAQLIAARNVTHLFYSFVGICDYERTDATNNQGLDNEFGANSRSGKTMKASCGQGKAPSYDGSRNADLVALGITEKKQDFEVSFYDYVAFPHVVEAFEAMKQVNPDLSAMLSVGGWTLSDPFYDLVADPNRRQVFINSVIQFLADHPVFDGVDLDWEFPGGAGITADLSHGYQKDRDNFTALVKELRVALNSLGQQNGRYYQLSAAISPSPAKLAAIDLNATKDDFDFINLMSYDLYGAWGSAPSHQTAINSKPVAAVYNDDVDKPMLDELGDPILIGGQPQTVAQVMRNFSTVGAIEAIIKMNPDFPMAKLNVGAASYGRGWKQINVEQQYDKLFWHGAAQRWSGGEGDSGFGSQGTFQFGVSDFRDIYDHYFVAGAPYLYYDEQAKAAYTWQPIAETWDNKIPAGFAAAKVETFDSPRSVIAKGELIKQYGLGGIFAWEAATDNGLILNAMNAAVCNPLATGQYYSFAQAYAGSVNSVVVEQNPDGTASKVKEQMFGPHTYTFDGNDFCNGVIVPTDEPPTIAPPTDEPPTIAPPTDEPPTVEPPTDEPPTLPPTEPPNGDYDFVYPSGLGSYKDGTKVLAQDGGIYQCKPFPFEGWCNGGGAYEPGVGRVWSDAWIYLGLGSGVTPPPVSVEPTPPPTDAPTTEPTPPPIGETTWLAEQVYTGGEQVLYNGVAYQAKWWTQGDNPELSGEWGVWKKL